ncbi:unnamed protein product [Calypogeia fissa]
MASGDKYSKFKRELKERALPECDIDEYKPPAGCEVHERSPPLKMYIRNNIDHGPSHNPSDSTPQNQTMPAGQSMEVADLVDTGSHPSSQRVQSRKSLPNMIPNAESRKWVDREIPCQSIENVLGERKRTAFDGFILQTQTAVSQQNGHDVQISHLKHAHAGEIANSNLARDIAIANCKRAYEGEIADLKHTRCVEILNFTHAKELEMAHLKHSHTLAIANLKHEKFSMLPEVDRSVQQSDAALKHVECKISAGQFAVEAEDGVQCVKNGLDELVQTKQSTVEEKNLGCRKHLQQMKDINLNGDCDDDLGLQKNSHQEVSSEKLEPTQESGDDKLSYAFGSSYADGEAKPKSPYGCP